MWGIALSGVRKCGGLWSVWTEAVASRALSLSAPRPIKEIVTEKTGDTFTVRGIIKPSERSYLLVKPPKPEQEVEPKKKCALCALGLDLKHTDVLILHQYLRTDGCMLPKRITGLCSMQQKRVSTLVRMAHKSGLMFTHTPRYCKRDKSRRKDYLKFNTYYDESTIFQKKPKHFSEKYRR